MLRQVPTSPGGRRSYQRGTTLPTQCWLWICSCTQTPLVLMAVVPTTRCLVPPRLATTPTPPVNPVESAVHHCGSSFDVGAPMAGKTGEIHMRQSGDCPCMAGPVLRRLSHHEPYAHPICVCRTAPFHHHNTISPRQTDSLADAISSKQFTKFFSLATQAQ